MYICDTRTRYSLLRELVRERERNAGKIVEGNGKNGISVGRHEDTHKQNRKRERKRREGGRGRGEV